ncbi:acyltransferase [Sediminicoccus sp. KRV36]|uniref:acyltransferase family protein n=1 Tax=Sediminicoccus sp. KRV36 TaxID=3133721 RepID=UPI00200F4BA5|nr:acyltransferase [Sediminicoccus rosea]UPY38521.1 acyltransferase [Sediminicoccus rosea]
MSTAPPIRSIQYLRACAALMIVIYHLGVPFSRAGYTGPWPAGLAHGVDLFFIISGFIMVIATQDRGVTPGLFLLRRLLRIAPLYYALTGFTLLVAALRPQLLQSFIFEWPHVIASVAFWPMINPATGETTPVLIPGWTLQYEMFFYLLFALAMPAGRWSLPLLCAMFLILVAVGQAVPGGTAFTFFTAPLILQFVMGVLLGRAFQHGRLPRVPEAQARLWSGVVLCGILLASIALVFAPRLLPAPWNPLQSGALATLVVAGLVWLEAQGRMPDWRWLLVAGDASYAIYLAHPSVLSATSQLWRMAGLPNSLWLLGLACVAASLAAGFFLHAAVELPLRRRFRRLTLAPAR